MLGIYLNLLLVQELGLRWLRNLTSLPLEYVQIVSLWKDVALVGLVIAAFLIWWKAGRPRTFLQNRTIAVGLFLFVVWAGLSAMLSPNRLAGLAAFRDYIEPLMILIPASLIQPPQRKFKRWLMIWLIVGGLIAILAIWQGLGWDRASYQQFGFGDVSSQVGVPTVQIDGQKSLRPPGTLTGPNELAVHLMLITSFLILGLRHRIFRARSWLLVLGIPILLALFLTASRSAILGTIVAVVGIVVQYITMSLGGLRWRKYIIPRNILISLAALLGIGLLLVTSGMFSRMAATMPNLGNQYHVKDTAEAIEYLILHPAGVGMGLVGPRQGFGFPPVASFHVEGSLFQIAMELGVWGLGLFLAMLALMLREIWRQWNQVQHPWLKTVCGTAFVGWLGSLVAFTFLPLMQAFPLMIWLWFLMGIGLSASKSEAAWQTE